MIDSGIETAARLLVVEGVNDKHVVRQIARRERGVGDFEIADVGGIEPLLSGLESRVNMPERIALGIVADADDDPNARWRSIRNRMPAHITLPERPASGGVIVAGQPRVGVWLMPNNADPGELEDFIRRMLPPNDSVWPLAEQYIRSIPASDRQFASGKTLRAQLYAWLATRRDPRRMGEAIRTRDLAVDGDLCREFVEWLRKLFA